MINFYHGVISHDERDLLYQRRKMPKRKRTTPKSSTKKSSSPNKQSRKDSEAYQIDLRGCVSTPGSLKTYLEENFSSPPAGKPWSIQTDHFPRGCMHVLLNHVSDHNGAISCFQNHYGKVYKYHLQNPDLKLLVKSHGATLTTLRMTPQNKQPQGSESSPAPKLQGCGYRWITLHARNLQVLELSLKYDVKQQLLDFSRRTPLKVHRLQELILWDVVRSKNTTIREQLVELIQQSSKSLHKLVLMTGVDYQHGGEDGEEDLRSFLENTAKEAGNDALKVEVKL